MQRPGIPAEASIALHPQDGGRKPAPLSTCQQLQARGRYHVAGVPRRRVELKLPEI